MEHEGDGDTNFDWYARSNPQRMVRNKKTWK